MPDLVASQANVWTRPMVRDRVERYIREHPGPVDVPNLCETIHLWTYRQCVKDMEQFSDIPGVLGRIQNELSYVQEQVDKLRERFDGMRPEA